MVALFVMLASLVAVGGAVDGVTPTALYFKACSGAHAEAWELRESSAEAPGVVALRSKSTQDCVVTGAAPLTTAPCNSTDVAQLFHWNATAKNGLPRGVAGFVRAASVTLACTDKGGHGSAGCCITNNGPAALMYGCCPSGPSDCGNQVLHYHMDGTIRDSRHPSDCLQHAPAPAPAPPAPPIPAQSSVPDPFEKLGAYHTCSGRD